MIYFYYKKAPYEELYLYKISSLGLIVYIDLKYALPLTTFSSALYDADVVRNPVILWTKFKHELAALTKQIPSLYASLQSFIFSADKYTP